MKKILIPLLLLSHSAIAQITFTPLGSGLSQAHALSSDGTKIAGRSGLEASTWESGSTTQLGILPGGNNSTAYGISGNGNSIVGGSASTLSVNTEAFLYRGSTMTALGDLAGGAFNSKANAASSNGKEIVGQGTSASGTEAFRWKNGNMTGLGDLAGGTFNSYANDVSGDGKIVVGTGSSGLATSIFAHAEAFRWQSGTMVGLGDLDGGLFASFGNGISSDGTTIVGSSHTASGFEAFRWKDGTMTGIGDLAGGAFGSNARSVSEDGSAIVGWSDSANGREAMLWTESLGMVSLLDYLGLNSVDGLTGWTLDDALDISADGTSIIGKGTNASGLSEQFLVTGLNLAAVPEPSTVAAIFGGALGLILAGKRRRKNTQI